MFNINMNMFEMYEVIVETYIEDNLVGRQQMQAPKKILMMSFIQNAQKLGNDTRPIKMVMIRQEQFWDNFEQKEKIFNHEVVFSNNARVAWENDRK